MKVKLKLPLCLNANTCHLCQNGFICVPAPSIKIHKYMGLRDLVLCLLSSQWTENVFSFVCNPYWWHECTKALVRIAGLFPGSFYQPPQILRGSDVVLLYVPWRHQKWALGSIHLGHDSFDLFILSTTSSNTWMKECTRNQRK